MNCLSWTGGKYIEEEANEINKTIIKQSKQVI